MKRYLWMTPFVGILFLTGGAIWAKPEVDSQEAKRKEYQEKVKAKKAELNGTEWGVAIKPQTTVKKASFPASDTLLFQNNQFSSSAASKLGFAPTNYTLTVKEAGPTIWETMQTSADKEGGIAFWRGEWGEEGMTGVIVRQIPEKPTEEYYFATTHKTEVPPTTTADEQGTAVSSEWRPDVMDSQQEKPSAAPAAPSGEKEEKKGFSFW